MKILFFSDNHWSQYSSIVRNRGEYYSKRLGNQIDTMNWLEGLAIEKGCGLVCCLGDFFDKSELNAEEISALTEVHWNCIHHIFIVGNHEVKTSEHNSLNALYSDDYEVFNEPFSYKLPNENIRLCIFPYMLNKYNRDELLSLRADNCRNILLTHNNIKGVQMGGIVTQDGIEMADIEDNFDLCFNGHYHNGCSVSDKIINIGNITGQNFSEDACKYGHHAILFDIDTFTYEFIENPYAFNFYKLSENEFNDLHGKLKPNSILSVKCHEYHYNDIKDKMASNKNIIQYRIIVEPNKNDLHKTDTTELVKVDHIKQFKDYCLSTMDNSDVLLQELENI